MTMFRVQVTGLETLEKKLDSASLLTAPVKDALTDIGGTLEAKAKQEIPVDTGTGRRNITHKVEGGNPPRAVRVGFSHRYLRFVHGDFDETKTRTRPHFPPIAPLRSWARRHGIPVFAVALGIARRGTPFVPFLTRAFQDKQDYIRNRFVRMAREIEGRWSS